MAINYAEWKAKVDKAFKDGEINTAAKFELYTKFQREQKKLTEEDAQKMFDSMKVSKGINIEKWNRMIDEAFKARTINKDARLELRKKFQSEYKKLTEEEAQKIFDSMKVGANAKVSTNNGKGINIDTWKNKLAAALKNNKMSKDDNDELLKIFQKDYKTLTEEEAEKMFKRKLKGINYADYKDRIMCKDKTVRFVLNKKLLGELDSLTAEQAEKFMKDTEEAIKKRNKSFDINELFRQAHEKAGEWKERVRKEFQPSNGPQYQRLMNRIDNGDIKTPEQFDKAIAEEKKDLLEQRNKLKLLKDELVKKVATDCKELSPVQCDEIKDKIDKCFSYDFIKARGEGKTEDQILNDIRNLYNNEVQGALNEARAYNLVNETVSKLRSVGNPESTELANRAEKVLNSMGPIKALEVAMNEVKALKSDSDKEVKAMKRDLTKAQKEADNAKEIIALSELELRRVRSVGQNSDLTLDSYPKFRIWVTKGSNAYKIMTDEFVGDIPEQEKVIKSKCGDATWVMFADKRDYEDCCKNLSKKNFYMASEVFDLKKSPDLKELQGQSAAINDINKILNSKEISEIISNFPKSINVTYDIKFSK